MEVGDLSVRRNGCRWTVVAIGLFALSGGSDHGHEMVNGFCRARRIASGVGSEIACHGAESYEVSTFSLCQCIHVVLPYIADVEK